MLDADQCGVTHLTAADDIHRRDRQWVLPGEILHVFIGQGRGAMVGDGHAVFIQAGQACTKVFARPNHQAGYAVHLRVDTEIIKHSVQILRQILFVVLLNGQIN